MNYYAVLGLQARVHLWLGEHDEALRYARLVKEATVAGEKNSLLWGLKMIFCVMTECCIVVSNCLE